MSNEAIRRARSVRGISFRAKLVLLLLADHADENGIAYPGQETLWDDGCMSRRSVQRAIGELQERVGLKVFNRVSNRGNHANGYDLKSVRLTPSNFQKRQLDRSKAPTGPSESVSLTPEPSGTLIEPSYTSPPSKKDIQKQAAEIYAEYPKKVAKVDGLKAITKALKKADFDTLIEKTRSYAKAVQAAGTEKQFIPHPAKWFNGERFNDDPAEWAPQPKSTSNSNLEII